MKKINLLLILFASILLIAGCGKEETKEKAKNIEGNLNDIIEKVYKDLPEDHTPNGLTNIELNDENIADYIGTKDIKYKEWNSDNFIPNILFKSKEIEQSNVDETIKVWASKNSVNLVEITEENGVLENLWEMPS